MTIDEDHAYCAFLKKMEEAKKLVSQIFIYNYMYIE